MPKNDKLQEGREIADRVIRRALAHPEFTKELKADPIKVLERAGLSAPAAEDVTRELATVGVVPAMRCPSTCVSTCYYTCFFTNW